MMRDCRVPVTYIFSGKNDELTPDFPPYEKHIYERFGGGEQGQVALGPLDPAAQGGPETLSLTRNSV